MRQHNFPPDSAVVERDEADAVFDEAVDTWVPRAAEVGMRILPIEEPVLQQLEAQGFRRATITRAQAPQLPADVPTLDFSGWPVFTLDSAPDDFVRACCAALEVRKGAIPWQGDGPLPLERMCIDAPDTPLTAPLHPAAEAFWRERGYLK